jgi:uncharacterized membrane protein YfcA
VSDNSNSYNLIMSIFFDYLDIIPVLVPLAMIVGFLVGATGVGGGAVMTPALIGILGLPAVTVIATDLVFAAVIKGAVNIRKAQRHLVDWQLAKRIWLGAIPAVLITAFLVSRLRVDFLVESLMLLVAIAVTLSGFSMFRQLRGGNTGKVSASQFGGVLGGLVGATSVGAGALGMVVLRRLVSPEAKPANLVATDLAVALPIAIAGGFVHLISGSFDFGLFTLLVLPGLPGAFLGAKFSRRVRADILRNILGVVLLLAGTGLFVKVLL